MLARIIGRIIILVLVLCILNVIYSHTLFRTDLREKCTEVYQIRSELDSTDVFYFGESSNVTYKKDDSIQESISELAAKFYPGMRFTTITKYASHAGIYKHWVEQLDKGDRKPSAVVVTMNLRSFDAAWIHSKLESALRETVVLAQPYPNLLNRFLLSLRAFDYKSEEQRELDMLSDWKNTKLELPGKLPYRTVAEWDYHFAQGYYTKPDGSWDQPKIELACHYIKAYAFNLDPKNPRVRDFDRISRWCSENKVRLYLNLMAENLQYADSLVGGELVFLMKKNRDFLVKRYTSENCVVVDNLEQVNGKEFIDQNWTTEHYDYRGRMRLARRLAAHMKDQFQHNYFPAY